MKQYLPRPNTTNNGSGGDKIIFKYGFTMNRTLIYVKVIRMQYNRE